MQVGLSRHEVLGRNEVPVPLGEQRAKLRRQRGQRLGEPRRQLILIEFDRGAMVGRAVPIGLGRGVLAHGVRARTVLRPDSRGR